MGEQRKAYVNQQGILPPANPVLFRQMVWNTVINFFVVLLVWFSVCVGFFCCGFLLLVFFQMRKRGYDSKVDQTLYQALLRMTQN